jgi:DNA-binding HxlR family transcriptional regulator
LLILRNAMIGMTRFDRFRAELGIADNVLSARLSRLVEAGILVRVPYRETGRTRHEYRLTTAGADLLPVLNALARWGVRHTDAPDAVGRMRILHSVCGSELEPGEHCRACGRGVSEAEISWTLPWRSDEPCPIAEPAGNHGAHTG